MIVYDKDGVAHEKQSVDARECVQVMGWTYEKPEQKKAKKEKSEKAADQESTEESNQE